MLDALRTRLWRLAFRLYPAYRGTGGRITHIEPDWSEVRVKLPLSWRTRNYVGTVYGGSMYGAVDPIYMLMLIKSLGDDYVVWDRAAEIEFKKPGEDTLYATCRLPEGELDLIRTELARDDVDSIDRVYTVDLVDDEGVVHATVEKTVYVGTDQSKAA
jgi:acyl-coenzyme A thioesterase PaaI-like protein